VKKIWLTIFIISALVIAFFIFYIPKNIDRNLIVYNSLVTYKDITYKDIEGEELKLDILMPTEIIYDETPVIFYVHGGDFVSGDKSWLTRDIGEDVARRILSEGYAIISLNYRNLDEDTHFPENLRDIKDSIRYMNSVALEYNIDTNNYGIWGINSGAYLALTVAYSPSGLYIGDNNLKNYSAEVNYVIDLHGITKMSQMWDFDSMTSSQLAEAESELNILYGTDFDINNLTVADYDTMAEFDPISFVSIDTVPTIIIHGELDSVVDITQSEFLETKLLEYSLDHVLYRIRGGTNGLSDISDSEVENICDYVYNFIDDNYR